MLDDIYYRIFLEVISQDPNLREINIDNLRNFKKNNKEISKYGQLIDLVYKTHNDSNIGLIYGKYLSPSVLCDYTRLLLTAPNLNTCLDIIQKFNHYLNPRYNLIIMRENGKVSVCITFPFEKEVPNSLKRFSAESLFSFAVNSPT